MRCAGCGHENPGAAKFCAECGARLALLCPQCRAELPAGAKFCIECGHKLTGADAAPAPASARPSAGANVQSRPASYTPKHLAEKILTSRSALEGERRQVTVLFSDVAGFTPLAEKLDPEDVHRIMDRCCRCASGSTRGRWSWDGSATTSGWITQRWGTRPTWPRGCSRWRAPEASC